MAQLKVTKRTTGVDGCHRPKLEYTIYIGDTAVLVLTGPEFRKLMLDVIKQELGSQLLSEVHNKPSLMADNYR